MLLEIYTKIRSFTLANSCLSLFKATDNWISKVYTAEEVCDTKDSVLNRDASAQLPFSFEQKLAKLENPHYLVLVDSQKDEYMKIYVSQDEIRTVFNAKVVYFVEISKSEISKL
jgi:hypothetical protein